MLLTKRHGERGNIMVGSKTCIECGGHVPPYLNYLCEDCWEKALNEKITEEDKPVVAAVKEIDIESPVNKWFR